MGPAHSVPKIAVIDDDVAVQRALANLLRSAGYRCALYGSAEEFLDECELPDCAIVDLHLPGSNGLDLQRRMNEKGQSIPIIIISAQDDRLRAKALEQGAVTFLAKPFERETLLAVIRSVTSGTTT